MPPTDRQSPSEPRWCVVCKDRPRQPGRAVCGLAQCVNKHHNNAHKSACGCVAWIAFVIGGIGTVFGYWLRGALS